MVVAFCPLLLLGYALLMTPADFYLDRLAAGGAVAAEEQETLLVQSSAEGGEAAQERRLQGVPPDMAQQILAMAGAGIAVWATCALISIVFAVQYKSKVTDQRPQWPEEGSAAHKEHKSEMHPGGDFDVQPFSCFDDIQYCLHGAFCGLCRAGDTMQAAGVTSYWAMIGVLIVAQLAAGALAQMCTYLFGNNSSVGQVLPIIFVGAAGMWHRQKLRTKLSGGIHEAMKDKSQAFLDCLLWGCCMCCAVVQEAREVDNAEGLRVECCCDLKSGGHQAPMVGVPVNAPRF